MNLTGKELAAQEIITNVDEENIAQHGIDLNLIKVESIFDEGFIPRKGKTKLPKYEEVPQQLIVIGQNEDTTPIEGSGWILHPGTYQVTFRQGCKIPADKMLLIRQRSSLMRNGGLFCSSVFDAGFETERIGTVMVLTHPVTIEYEARVAQIYAHNSNVVENLYTGQFQKDTQRKS